MANKLICCCLECRNLISTNNLSIHYRSKQCYSGELFSLKIKKAQDRTLNCNFCNFIGKNLNSISQHETVCKSNPNKKFKTPSYGMKGKINGEASNQYMKAKRLGLPVPKMNESTKEKLIAGWRKSPKSYSSKQATKAIDQILALLSGENYGKIYYAGNGREFWLSVNREKYFFYDCCLKDLKIIIEYQGIAFHPKNILDEFRVPFKNMGTKEDCWNKDRLKEKLAREHGYIVEYIWSDNTDEDVERIVQIIKEKIKSMV